MINDTKPLPIVIRGLLNDTPSGLRGVTNKVNPSGVEVLPKPTVPNITGVFSDTPAGEHMHFLTTGDAIQAEIQGT
jgi:hypothetical protein